MNNDLENLLASSPRPTPSTDLDRRIAAVRLPERLRDDVIPSQRWFSRLIVTATCAAISGFALGRISAPVAPAAMASDGTSVRRRTNSRPTTSKEPPGLTHPRPVTAGDTSKSSAGGRDLPPRKGSTRNAPGVAAGVMRIASGPQCRMPSGVVSMGCRRRFHAP